MRLIESEKTVKIGHVRYQTTRHKFANQKMMSIWLSGSIVLYRTTPLQYEISRLIFDPPTWKKHPLTCQAT